MNNFTELRIVIADDHAFLLQGLREHLASKGIHVVGQAQDGTQALKLITDLAPDIAILDVEMPYLSGFSVAEICKQNAFTTKVVILSIHKEPDFIKQAKRLGISGYILKEDATSEIFECIEAVQRGGSYFSNALTLDLKLEEDKLGLVSNLTPSERKILRLIAQKMSTIEIADQLFISERTVEKHRSNIVAKLELSGRSYSLTTWAVENKVIISTL